MGDLNETAATSLLYAGNAPFLEALYEEYLGDPAAVPAAWKAYFDALSASGGGSAGQDSRHREILEDYRQMARRRGRLSGRSGEPGLGPEAAQKQGAVLRLIRAYRLLGHLRARVDSIGLSEPPAVPDLDPAFHGLDAADLDRVFNTGTLLAPREARLRDILRVLDETYLGPIGVEYIHISDVAQRQWIEHRFESCRSRPAFSAEEKRDILLQLTAAEGLERYLHTKYAGQKRFSLEGGESLIPLLNELTARAAGHSVKEIAIGMAHRGRLNVLINIMGKLPADLFQDFEGAEIFGDVDVTSGDVKYHQGFSADALTPHGPVHLALAFNPSHLEIINPVVEGSVRARQERRGDDARGQVIAILVHGDASIAGQGVVYETLNLAQTRGFTTGGTVHIVVNNRIGFTLSHPMDVRSTLYCTDIAKVVQAPVFHVDGDDPEAVIFAARTALDFRMAFHKDVMIDLVCFRRHGHNEADEPAVTQPVMYEKIRRHPGVRHLFARKLVEEGAIGAEEPDRLAQEYRDALDAGRRVAFFPAADVKYPYIADWSIFLDRRWTEPAETALPIQELKRLGAAIHRIPDDFELHPRVAKILSNRRKMVAGGLPVDWGCAETLAYASLLEAGYPVRLTGQDSGRGTFFHRHAVLHNQRGGEIYIPLRHVAENQPRFTVIDSILSEEAVVGFEYGYSTTDPGTLVVWEAQFGDFANVAQVVIDQFISSSEQKWERLCGLVLLLPHGWEGQGPEHTSARLERFLQLCSQENIQVAVPTTPAQMFHLLRRQMLRRYRKPLVVMSPKSMLRDKLSFSPIEDLTSGGFQTVIPEADPIDALGVARVVLCSGKVYYDLLQARRKENRDDIAILRVEQLYPFPRDELAPALAAFPRAGEVVWAQEEPMNQGAWYSIQHLLRASIRPTQSLSYTGRPSSAAPAGGHHKQHMVRQERLVQAALNRQGTEPAPLLVFPAQQPTSLQPARS